MLQKITQFLDFDPRRQGPGTVADEFNHKYKDSWLFVNGKPAYILGLVLKGGRQELHVQFLNGRAEVLENIESISPYNPKTGLYASPEGLLYLYRMPARQWTKGFKPGKNYQHKILIKDNPGRDFNVVKFLNHKEVQYQPESLILNEKVFLHWKHVGDFDNTTQKIHLKNNHFTKELEELWPQFQITLDALSPKKSMEERLILDF